MGRVCTCALETTTVVKNDTENKDKDSSEVFSSKNAFLSFCSTKATNQSLRHQARVLLQSPNKLSGDYDVLSHGCMVQCEHVCMSLLKCQFFLQTQNCFVIVSIF